MPSPHVVSRVFDLVLCPSPPRMGCRGGVHRFVLLFFLFSCSFSEDPYRFLTWNVSSTGVTVDGITKTAILINDQFPGPLINATTNDNVLVNVFNNLDVPFLVHWNSIQQRKNSWADGASGSTCAISPGANYTYKMQMKDQIGSYSYYPSVGLQKVDGGYGPLVVMRRSVIALPFNVTADEFVVLVADWYSAQSQELVDSLAAMTDMVIPSPDALIMRIYTSNGSLSDAGIPVEQGKTYLIRVVSVTSQSSFSFSVLDHTLQLVEVEGSYSVQTNHTTFPIHPGQASAFLLTASRDAGTYEIMASTLFSKPTLNCSSSLVYTGDGLPVNSFPSTINYSTAELIAVSNSIRRANVSGPRPNHQLSYNYSDLLSSCVTIVFKLSTVSIDGKPLYGINNVSYVEPDEPFYLSLSQNDSTAFQSVPAANFSSTLQFNRTFVIQFTQNDNAQFVLQNMDNVSRSLHFDGYSLFQLGSGLGEWSNASSSSYNLYDTVARSTFWVPPGGWTAVIVSMDNAGVWNFRSENLFERFLGMQLYLRVVPLAEPDEYPMPDNWCAAARNPV